MGNYMTYGPVPVPDQTTSKMTYERNNFSVPKTPNFNNKMRQSDRYSRNGSTL